MDMLNLRLAGMHHADQGTDKIKMQGCTLCTILHFDLLMNVGIVLFCAHNCYVRCGKICKYVLLLS